LVQGLFLRSRLNCESEHRRRFDVSALSFSNL
jgi:hypothetical protein